MMSTVSDDTLSIISGVESYPGYFMHLSLSHLQSIFIKAKNMLKAGKLMILFSYLIIELETFHLNYVSFQHF